MAKPMGKTRRCSAAAHSKEHMIMTNTWQPALPQQGFLSGNGKYGSWIIRMQKSCMMFMLRGLGLYKLINPPSLMQVDVKSTGHAKQMADLDNKSLWCNEHHGLPVRRAFLTRGTSACGRVFRVYACDRCGDFVALGDARDPRMLFRGRFFKERTYRPSEVPRCIRAAASLLVFGVLISAILN